VLAEAGAPIAHAGAVVSDDPVPPLGLLVGAHVGAPGSLGPFLLAPAVGAPRLASDLTTTAEAGAEQAPGHRGLHRCSPRLCEPG
jgi:hypothetical protein